MTDFPEIMSIWTPDYVRDFPNIVCENGAMAAARIETLEAENARLREALEWYGEQARLCRLVHREGDAGRHALNADGGSRARAALKGEGR